MTIILTPNQLFWRNRAMLRFVQFCQAWIQRLHRDVTVLTRVQQSDATTQQRVAMIHAARLVCAFNVTFMRYLCNPTPHRLAARAIRIARVNENTGPRRRINPLCDPDGYIKKAHYICKRGRAIILQDRDKRFGPCPIDRTQSDLEKAINTNRNIASRPCGAGQNNHALSVLSGCSIVTIQPGKPSARFLPCQFVRIPP